MHIDEERARRRIAEASQTMRKLALLDAPTSVLLAQAARILKGCAELEAARASVRGDQASDEGQG
jgi:hypothetical protein